MASMLQEATVIIIGAGAAGIYAARCLREKGCKNVIVLEARERAGGRICNTSTESDPRFKGFAPFPIELGPEFIHGQTANRLLDYFKKHGVSGKPNATTMQMTWPNYFYFGKEGRLVSGKESETDKELQRMLETFEMTGDLDPELIPDESLLQYMVRMGTPSRVIDMADAIFANDYGAEASRVGLKEIAVEQDSWKNGEDYLVLDGCNFSDIIKDMAKDLDIRTSWKVKEVLHGGPCGRCRVIRDNGESLQADRLIVTLPNNILRDGDVVFKPPLSSDKVDAIKTVKQSNCIKVILKLQNKFWPDDCWNIVCADSFIPEIWLTPAADVLKLKKMPHYYMVGFCAGDRATRIAQLPHAEAARRMCLQLDAMFGSVAIPHPASQACCGFVVQDWGQDVLAKGAYSHPTLGAYGQREIVARAQGAVFFAGEATNTGLNPCIQGAMETGERAVDEILDSFKPKSKL